MSPTPRRPKPADAVAEPPDGEERVALDAEVDGQPVGGVEAVVDSPVELQVQPTFTPAQVKEDGKNRVARTGYQSVVALASTVIIRYLIGRYIGESHVPPEEVMDAFQTIVTVAAAVNANKDRLRGEG